MCGGGHVADLTVEFNKENAQCILWPVTRRALEYYRRWKIKWNTRIDKWLKYIVIYDGKWNHYKSLQLQLR